MKTSAIIISPNPNVASVDSWALVSNNVVVNSILDSTEDMSNSVILQQYDYVIDMTILGQFAGPGDAYDPVLNRFIYPPPPPIDWISTVVNDFDEVVEILLQLLSDSGSTGGNLTPTQLQNCFNAMLEDEQDNFTQNQRTLMNAVYTYILNGG